MLGNQNVKETLFKTLKIKWSFETGLTLDRCFVCKKRSYLSSRAQQGVKRWPLASRAAAWRQPCAQPPEVSFSSGFNGVERRPLNLLAVNMTLALRSQTRRMRYNCPLIQTVTPDDPLPASLACSHMINPPPTAISLANSSGSKEPGRCLPQ